MNGRRLDEQDPLQKKKKWPLWAALALCVCVMAGAAFYIIHNYWQVFAQRSLEGDVRDMFENAKSGLPGAIADLPEPAAGTAEPPPDGSPPPDGDDEEEEWAKEYRRLLELEKLGMEIYAELLAQNPDFRGMVRIPGLGAKGINTPYVHTLDNDTYLEKAFDGKNSKVGTIFLNCYNDRLLMDRNSVLYGHNIKEGDMFAPILNYKNAAAFQKAPAVYLDSLTGETVWIVFAAYVTDPYWGYHEPTPGREAFADLLDEIKARSLFITDVDVNEDDRILTLSTCDYSTGAEDMRFAVHARLLRPGEEIPEAVTAEKNPEQKKYNVPSQKKLSEITANRTAVMQQPNSSKLYFYQPRDGGIDWYSGNSSVVQGVYSNYTGKGVSQNSYMAAAYDPDPDKKMVYVVMDGFNRQKGIYLFTNRLASGDLIYRGAVTPPGVDAKFPAMVYDDDAVWLLYTVAHDGGEDIYRRKLYDGKAAGDPELLLAAPAGSGARPLGCYTVDGSLLVFWHETVNQKVYGAWEGLEPFDVALGGDADRVTLYGAVSGGKIKAAEERKGKFKFTSVDLGALPPSPPRPSADPGDGAGTEPGEEPPAEPEPTETAGSSAEGGEAGLDGLDGNENNS